MREKLFTKAFEHYLVTAIRGKRHNPIIQGFLRTVGYGRTDDLNWCAAFIASVAEEVGAEYSASPTARSWRKVGTEVALEDAKIGHVVVFWRGSKRGWKGHVGLYAGRKGKYIRVYGGNQGRKVCLKYYPVRKLLSIRELRCGT